MDQFTLRDRISAVLKLSDEEFNLLEGFAMSRKLKKGEALLKEGEICRAVYLVEKGYLRTWYNKDGEAINLNFSFEGDFTANFKSIKSRLASEFIIEAGEEAEVWIFDLNKISAHSELYPQITQFIRRLAFRILLASEEYSNLFKISTPTERYLYIEKNNPQLLQRISLSQMASYLGITSETLSRIRAKKPLTQ